MKTDRQSQAMCVACAAPLPRDGLCACGGRRGIVLQSLVRVRCAKCRKLWAIALLERDPDVEGWVLLRCRKPGGRVTLANFYEAHSVLRHPSSTEGVRALMRSPIPFLMQHWHASAETAWATSELVNEWAGLRESTAERVGPKVAVSCRCEQAAVVDGRRFEEALTRASTGPDVLQGHTVYVGTGAALRHQPLAGKTDPSIPGIARWRSAHPAGTPPAASSGPPG